MDKKKVYNQEAISGEDLKKLLYRYLNYWPLFVLSVFVFILGGYVYLRYSTSIYSTKAKVKILDESDSGLDFSSMSGSKTLFNLSKINLGNEMQVLKSRRLIGKVVDQLNLNTFYYSDANIKTYLFSQEEVPFKVNWLTKDSINTPSSPAFKIKLKNENFEIGLEESKEVENISYGDTVNISGFRFLVEKNSNRIVNKPIYVFRYSNTESLISQLKHQITVEPSEEDKSDILQLSISGPNKNRNENIINSLISQFNQDGIEDKRLISKRTEDFVEDRILLLEEELDTVESGLVSYKNDNNLVAIEANTEQLFGKETQAEAGRLKVNTQLLIAKEFKNELDQLNDFELLPVNFGLEDVDVNNLTKEYNTLISERNRLLISSTQANPLILNINDKIGELKNSIKSSVDSYIRSLEISLQNFEQQEGSSSGALKSLPQKEKEIREIMRQQEVKERLYLFLLQKREEAALSFAITAPTVKIVDYAYTNPSAILPNRSLILLGALVAGFALPVVILYLRFLLNTRINSKDDLENKVDDLKVIAEIPELKKGANTLIKSNDQTVLAESFRILRTNLNYFSPKIDKESGLVIFVTSTTKGEGKTFTGINLANSFASTNKRVLLVGGDLRNPQIHTYIQKDKNHLGVSAFLSNPKIQLEELILKNTFQFSNLDVVLSGSIPPNPAELLMNGRMEVLLEQAKSLYDIVIVDTAPTILVTDTLLISKLSDITVYMLRADVTEKRLLNHIKELHQNRKLNNVGLVLNGVKANNGYGYNYGYGYGYTEDNSIRKSPWEFWK